MCTAKRLIPCALALLLFTGAALGETYVPSRRDTKPAPEAVAIVPVPLDAYTLLREDERAAYYWREDRDIIAVVDKANGYTWKTGADIGFPKAIEAAVKAAQTDEQRIKAAEPLEKSMNSTYIGVANSLLTCEYRIGKNFYIGSAAEKGASSTLSPVPGEPGRYVLACEFSEIDLRVRVYVTLLQCGLRYDIPAEEITGAGRSSLTALWLTPFLGASGGEAEFFDPVAMEYAKKQSRPAIPGYALVPDGSGVLVRFMDNTVPFVEYVGDVYGPDLATETYNYLVDTDALALKSPVAPVFGIAHGDRQAAFVAYAEKGGEYLDIVMRPDENLRLKYNFCYPRFEYNVEYYRVYNRKGQGYFTMGGQPFDYDAGMTYVFLHGDGSDGTPPADYAGMAAAYREHLVAQGALRDGQAAAGDIPLRLDFILSDIKNGLIGPEQVVVTTAQNVRDIVDQVRAAGITRISGGLTGWQAGAQTLARPDSLRFFSGVGSEGDFRALIADLAGDGAQFSLARDYSTINQRMTGYLGVASKHMNTWYIIHDRSALYEHAPVTEFSYALATRAAEWFARVANHAAGYSASLTVSGITANLTSSYDRAGVAITLPQAIQAFRDSMAAAVQAGLTLDLQQPNVYLWEYAGRYLLSPVGGSQYVFQTDDVPFLQMVLRGTMEVYGPYCNFSFYTRQDILRMIDYNVSPSFILSAKPSYLLTDTLSSDLYSTEYAQYETLIRDIYAQVNAALAPVAQYLWYARLVPQNGLVVNLYRKDGETAAVAINYTQDTLFFEGRAIAAQSAEVITGGGTP